MRVAGGHDHRRGRRWDLRFGFDWRELWVGARWASLWNLGYEARNGTAERSRFDLRVCLLPGVVLHYCWWLV